jgi:anti-sigma regulatory factor (Ser/Thr protein kinase)
MSSNASTGHGAGPGQRRRCLFGPTGQVRLGRAFASRALSDWGAPGGGPAVAEDARLVVSELLSNACRHAGGPAELVLSLTGGTLRIEVLDGSPALPSPRMPHDASRPSGHGLHLVQRLSSAWGVTGRADGKSVWAELAWLPADG